MGSIGELEVLRRNRPPKRFRGWVLSLGGIVVVGGLIFSGILYYQTSHFNRHTIINGVNVGGLTADKALQKLEGSILKNQVYIGQNLIFDGKNTKMGISDKDLPLVNKILKAQQTVFPSLKTYHYTLKPSEENSYKSQTMKALVKRKLIDINKTLNAPQDAKLELEQGKIVVTKSVNGQQYDITRLLQDYQNQEYQSDIHLKPVYIAPINETSPLIKNEKKSLQTLLQRIVNFKVQNKVYVLKASELIKNTSLSKSGQFVINPSEIKKEIEKINNTQSTLNKPFQFKTHSGSVISVQDQTYGWALNVDKETKQILNAFEKGQTSVVASNVYGNGWNNEAIGYNTVTNNGIGNSYAEVSIKQQRIWLYKNGTLILTTNVVTGRHDVKEDTHPGVWYILYKQSPSILVGSEVGMSSYRIQVKYWAAFTNDGEGFHDASWRTNWTNTAYLHQGSGGCVNTPPSVMGSVYKDLSDYEPVIVY